MKKIFKTIKSYSLAYKKAIINAYFTSFTIYADQIINNISDEF